jgi:hypothetical protein
MTENEAKDFVQGKLDCMNKSYVFDCKGTDECDNCQYCYSQGNFGEQKKAFETAIQALEEIQQYRAIGTVEEFKALKEKNTPKEIEFMHNRSDTVSVWKCHCGNIFLTKHKEGILDGTDVNYCCKCGQKLDWQ